MAALEESLDWHERYAPRTANAILNAGARVAVGRGGAVGVEAGGARVARSREARTALREAA